MPALSTGWVLYGWGRALCWRCALWVGLLAMREPSLGVFCSRGVEVLSRIRRRVSTLSRSNSPHLHRYAPFGAKVPRSAWDRCTAHAKARGYDVPIEGVDVRALPIPERPARDR